jgi:hypothetical protein
MIDVSGSQIGLVGAVGLSILYKISDSDTIAKVVAVTAIGSVLAAGVWVAGTVQKLVATNETYLKESPTAKSVTSIALGMLAGVGAIVLVSWTALAVLDRSFSSYN